MTTKNIVGSTAIDAYCAGKGIEITELTKTDMKSIDKIINAYTPDFLNSEIKFQVKSY